MLKSFSILVLFTVFAVVAQAKPSQPDYQCIYDKLNAHNSSIYFDITPEEIDKILADETHAFYSSVAAANAKCEEEKKNK